MSGVEVAGFIMAAFPLIISALEDYRQGWEMIDDWWKIKREYKKCQQNLKLQKLVFEENLEQLLSTLTQDEDELKMLIAKPGGEMWRDADLEAGLQERLPRSYEVYLEIINEMVGVMNSLKKELGIDVLTCHSKVAYEETVSISSTGSASSLQVKARAKPNLEYQMQRIKFTFNKKPRNKLIDDLALYNSRLRELLDSSDRLAASRQRRKKRSGTNLKMAGFWEHAKNIYDLLKNAWCCDCSSLHKANLLLQYRTDPEVELSVSFVYSLEASPQAKIPWESQKTTIRKLVDESILAIPVPSVISAPTRTGFLPRPSLRSRTERSSKGVQWQVADTPTKPAVDNLPEINDLCSIITTASSDCQSLECLGCMEDVECNRYCMYPQATEEQDQATITLGTLLSKASPIRLTRRQRYDIALTIASSHLQLHDSPWLGPQWSKKDILFHRRDDHSIDNRPYISRSFHSNLMIDPPTYMVSDHGMSTLGILLLELCFGSALEDHEIRRNFPTLDGAANSALDLVAAMQWCDRYANDEAGPEFAEAIKWCLSNPTRRGDDRKAQGWRGELWSQVVEPLQYCHRQLSADIGQ